MTEQPIIEVPGGLSEEEEANFILAKLIELGADLNSLYPLVADFPDVVEPAMTTMNFNYESIIDCKPWIWKQE